MEVGKNLNLVVLLKSQEMEEVWCGNVFGSKIVTLIWILFLLTILME